MTPLARVVLFLAWPVIAGVALVSVAVYLARLWLVLPFGRRRD